MSRINFTKIEQLLDEGLRKINVERLIFLADIAAHLGEAVNISSKAESEEQKKREEEGKLLLQKRKDCAKLYTNLLKLAEKDPKIYVKIEMKKSSVDRLLEKSDTLSEREWKIVRILLNQTNELMKEYYPNVSDEELIESEIERHMNKRFNISEKWLPLQ